MTTTNRPNTGNTTYHRDGTVTVWDCIQQVWVRGRDLSDELFSTLGEDEREKIANHTA